MALGLLLVDEPPLSSAIDLATVSLSLSLCLSLSLSISPSLCIRSKLAGVFFRCLADLYITVQLNPFLSSTCKHEMASFILPFLVVRPLCSPSFRGGNRRNYSAFQSRFSVYSQCIHRCTILSARVSLVFFLFLFFFLPSAITSARIRIGRAIRSRGIRFYRFDARKAPRLSRLILFVATRSEEQFANDIIQ